MNSAKDTFSRYLSERGVRASRQRDQVLDVFLETERHVNLYELTALVKKKHPKIGYATVSRAMKLFCDASVAEETDFGDGALRYEHCHGHEHHDHLVCLKCGNFLEVVSPEIERLQIELAKTHDFKPERHKLLIFGLCKSCQ